MAISLERIIRPFVIVESRPQQTVAPVPLTDLEDIPDVFLQWGESANFLLPQLDRPVVVKITEPIIGDVINGTIPPVSEQISDFEDRIDELEEEPDLEEQIFIFTEIERTTDVVTISSTSEAGTISVDVERILTIIFRAPGGEKLKYVLKHGDA